MSDLSLTPQESRHQQQSCLSVLQNSNVGGYSSKGFVEVLAASQSPAGSRWFQGTADAVRQYLWLFEDAMRSGVEDFLILSGQSLIISWRCCLASGLSC